jgi:hypothetical protein
MPDLHVEPWATAAAFIRHPVLPVAIIVVFAWLATRVATQAVRRA